MRRAFARFNDRSATTTGLAATDEALDCCVPLGVASLVCELLDACGDAPDSRANLTSGPVCMEYLDHAQRWQRLPHYIVGELGREALANAGNMA